MSKMTKNLKYRKLISKIFMRACLVSALIAIGILLVILLIIAIKGIGALNLNVFTKDTASPWDNGGLRNVIIGQIILSLGAFLIGTPFGILGGTYLREYARNKKIIHSLYDGVKYNDEIIFNNKNILNKKIDNIALCSKIVMIFQKPTPFPMSIFDNIAYGLRLKGIKINMNYHQS